MATNITYNPFVRDDFDRVGSGGGGGSGTVTSVSGGEGITITGTPTVAPIVNLDINKLTAEATLAAGDLFPFLDVSVGVGVTAQRKVTLANLIAAISAGLTVTCAMAPDLLCLDGRAGTANDPIIRTDGEGNIYGSASPAAGFAVNSNTSTSLDGFVFNKVNANIDTWNGFNALLSFGAPGSASTNLTINDIPATFPAVVLGYFVTGDWTIGDDSMGGSNILLFRFEPTIHNPPGVGKILCSDMAVFSASPTFVADGAACTLGTSPAGHGSRATFRTDNGGTLQGISWIDYGGGTIVEPGVDFSGGVIGYQYDGVTGGGTISGFSAFLRCEDGDVIGATGHFSLLSIGGIRVLAHTGPGVFGTTTVTNASVGLEVNNPNKTFLTSRQDTAEETALTGADGFFLFNTDRPSDWPFRGFDTTGGGWRSFVMDDGAGNVNIPGKLTVVGAIDPTSITIDDGVGNPFATLARSGTPYATWSADGTDVFFDYATTLRFREAGGPTEVVRFDSNSAIFTVSDLTVVGGDVDVDGDVSGTNIAASGELRGATARFSEQIANPADPDISNEFRLYMKADKCVLQFNDGGTVRYFTLDLTQSGATATWAQSTSAP